MFSASNMSAIIENNYQYILGFIFFVLGSLSMDASRRKTANPHKPYFGCFIDSVVVYLQAMKLSYWAAPNNIYEAVACALKKTGLKDFGGVDQSTFIERYNVARTIGLQKSKAKYSPSGYAIASEILTQRMIARLEFFNYLKKHPSIEKIPIKEPIFIIGFPRTGTTFLHELLSLHPSVRVHYTWEQMRAIPLTDDESIAVLEKKRQERYHANKMTMRFLFSIVGDEIQSIHRVEYDEPEECTTPLALELPWAIPELPLYIFAAKEVIALKGAGEGFKHYRKFLQLMTWQAAERRDRDFTWMLKCPFHLPYLDKLYEAFPQATVVWTHRDPVECIASACSLYEALLHWVMEEKSIDRVALGKAVMEYSRIALDMAFKTIDKYKDKVKIVHIRYADNVKNPKTCLEGICKKSGLAFDEEYIKLVDTYLAKNAEKRDQMKKKKTAAELHVYKPEDYGLTAEGIRNEFKDYIAEYKLAK